MKIYLLMALVGAIAAISHIKPNRKPPRPRGLIAAASGTPLPCISAVRAQAAGT